MRRFFVRLARAIRWILIAYADIIWPDVAGFYDSPWSGKHPRLQILTVEELLAGKKIDMPPVRQVETTFKKAPKAKGRKREDQGELSLE